MVASYYQKDSGFASLLELTRNLNKKLRIELKTNIKVYTPILRAYPLNVNP
jgi:hypothetical protein